MEKTHGYHTASRAKIMEFLVDNQNHAVSAGDISRYLMKQDMQVNISTVYRYLDKLTKEGSVNKFTNDQGKNAVYQYAEGSRQCDQHIHMQCTKCGAVIHLECDFMDEISNHIKAHHGFDLQCKNSVLYGLCKNCAE